MERRLFPIAEPEVGVITTGEVEAEGDEVEAEGDEVEAEGDEVEPLELGGGAGDDPTHLGLRHFPLFLHRFLFLQW